jgi:hypothetical protein
MDAPGPYDPDRGPDPDAWLALSTDERVAAIEAWAERAGGARRLPTSAPVGRTPNLRVYAVMLSTVETQVAHGDELPVAAVLARLVDQGMSRREGVHALATVLAERTYDAFYGEIADDPEAAYFADLATLTPESWRNRFDDDLALPVF